ncbi:MAG TPA: molybdopterin molybdenumtransferase MoeA [Devosia sp.]|nr:molybdopterin molybdenumtransferase MoeA [Devosia sp.]
MLPFDDALKLAVSHGVLTGSEPVALLEANGRVLAAPVTARTDQPPFDASAMDGYGVRARDVHAGATLKLVGTSQAGAGYDGTLAPGECIRILTGAPTPAGVDAVVMQEKVTVDGPNATFQDSVNPGSCIRKTGNDFKMGDVLVAAGKRLNPASLALIAAGNVPQIEVRQRPHIDLLATGDELATPGDTLAPGQIVGSNRFGLAPLLTPLAAAVHDLGSAHDEEQPLRAALEAALSGPSDVLITTGGVSVGDRDLVVPVLKSLGAKIMFWKVAIRPGKPVVFARLGDKLIFGLPGNPVSAFVSAITLVLPALKALNGIADPLPRTLHLPLASPLPANGPRRHFMRGRLTSRNGATAIEPIVQMDSAHLSSFSEADGLVVIEENRAPADADSLIPFISFAHEGIPASG